MVEFCLYAGCQGVERELGVSRRLRTVLSRIVDVLCWECRVCTCCRGWAEDRALWHTSLRGKVVRSFVFV